LPDLTWWGVSRQSGVAVPPAPKSEFVFVLKLCFRAF